MTEEITAAAVGPHRLVIVRDGGRVRIFSADCPHRGAHLGYGGRLNGQTLVCPFHGYHIGLGCESAHGFTAREYPSLSLGPLTFVRLSADYDNGFATFLQRLSEDHVFVPGFKLQMRVTPNLVIENGFDHRHFNSVHRIAAGKFSVRPDESGSLIVESQFSVPSGRPGEGARSAQYIGQAFSPGLFASYLGGDPPYRVITGATPAVDGTCAIRLALALPVSVFGPVPDPAFCARLLEYSRNGLADDGRMWENLSPTAPHRLTGDDEPVRLFHAFCRQIQEAASA